MSLYLSMAAGQNPSYLTAEAGSAATVAATLEQLINTFDPNNSTLRSLAFGGAGDGSRFGAVATVSPANATGTVIATQFNGADFAFSIAPAGQPRVYLRGTQAGSAVEAVNKLDDVVSALVASNSALAPIETWLVGSSNGAQFGAFAFVYLLP